MGQLGISYEEKYGWNRQSLRLTGITLIFCAAALAPGMPLWLRILDAAFFGGGSVMIAVLSLGGATAIRVDQAGVTLCSSPVYPKSTTRLFPWEDIASVIIWPGRGRINGLEYVGVERRPGAPPLTGRFLGQRSQSVASLASPGIPAEVTLTRAATNGWVLDHGRLTAAVAHFAPTVRVLDATSRRPPAGPPDQP